MMPPIGQMEKLQCDKVKTKNQMQIHLFRAMFNNNLETFPVWRILNGLLTRTIDFSVVRALVTHNELTAGAAIS